MTPAAAPIAGAKTACKDILDKHRDAISLDHKGTKAAGHFIFNVPAGKSVVINCRLCHAHSEVKGLEQFEETFAERLTEADEFYNEIIPDETTPEERVIFREGYAGLLWTKQFYNYVVDDWLKGDRRTPDPSDARKSGRNSTWDHFFARDILSMPDKWEYPWFAAWDTAFHMIPFSAIVSSISLSQEPMASAPSFLTIIRTATTRCGRSTFSFTSISMLNPGRASEHPTRLVGPRWS